MTEILDHLKPDPVTGWDCLNAVVDGIALHAISFLRPSGFHEGSIVTDDGHGNTGRYPISLDHSVADCTENELEDLVRELREEPLGYSGLDRSCDGYYGMGS